MRLGADDPAAAARLKQAVEDFEAVRGGYAELAEAELRARRAARIGRRIGYLVVAVAAVLLWVALLVVAHQAWRLTGWVWGWS